MPELEPQDALKATLPIVQEAIAWVSRHRLSKYGWLDIQYVSHSDWLKGEHATTTQTAKHAMDAAAITGDVDATKAAARIYCQAWKDAFAALPQKMGVQDALRL